MAQTIFVFDFFGTICMEHCTRAATALIRRFLITYLVHMPTRYTFSLGISIKKTKERKKEKNQRMNEDIAMNSKKGT